MHLCSAEVVILKASQATSFREQIMLLKKDKSRLTKRDPLYKLNPVLDNDGLLRVSRRLERSSLTDREKHPIILPKQSHITQLAVRFYHQEVNHQGRGMTINQIWASGFWILGYNRIVRSQISKCVICRRWRSSVQTQRNGRTTWRPTRTCRAVSLLRGGFVWTIPHQRGSERAQKIRCTLYLSVQ